jgi:hypothetical protein
VKGKDLQKAVVDYAHLKHWTVAHFPAVETTRGWRTAIAGDARGFPDLLLVRERIVVIEIKGDGDTVKPEQEEWQRKFRAAGAEAYVVRPKDWPDVVREILD